MARTSDPGTAPRWLRWLRREEAPPAPRAPDPADMGTCYGLEMSLDDAPVDPFRRAPIEHAAAALAAYRTGLDLTAPLPRRPDI